MIELFGKLLTLIAKMCSSKAKKLKKKSHVSNFSKSSNAKKENKSKSKGKSKGDNVEKAKRLKRLSRILNIIATIVDAIEKLVLAIISFVMAHILIIAIVVIIILVIILGITFSLDNGSECICERVQSTQQNNVSSVGKSSSILTISEAIVKDMDAIRYDLAHDVIVSGERHRLTQNDVDKKGDTKSHMSWTAMTSEGSDQAGLMYAVATNNFNFKDGEEAAKALKGMGLSEAKKKLTYEENNIGFINGRYTIAIKPDLGKIIGDADTGYEIGDYINVVLESGVLIECIIADQKSSENKSIVLHYDGSIIEFVTSPNYKGPGGLQVLKTKNWGGAIKEVYRVGTCWTKSSYYNMSTDTSTPNIVTTENTSYTGADVLKEALRHKGANYVYGAAGPDTFDCSGLTQYVYKALGVTLDRTSGAQSIQNVGTVVTNTLNFSKLHVGDLLFFGKEGNVHHVGIYAGNKQMFHAPQTGKTVDYTNIDTDSRKNSFVCARRIFNEEGDLSNLQVSSTSGLNSSVNIPSGGIDINNIPTGYANYNGYIIKINDNCPIHGTQIKAGSSSSSLTVSGNLRPRLFDTAQAGVIQGDWPAEVKQKMMTYTYSGGKYSDIFGRSYTFDHPDEIMSDDVTWDEWRHMTKWEVPYYMQSDAKEYSAAISFGSINKGNSCHVFMSSYIMSALTGKMINWAECLAALRATGGVDGSGLFFNASADKTFNKLGIAWIAMKKDGTIINPNTQGVELISQVSGTAQDKINWVLDHGGIVGWTGNSASDFAANGHFFVLTDHQGNDKYKIYASCYRTKELGKNKDGWIEWDRLWGNNGSLLRVMGDGSQFFLAMNFDALSTGTSETVITGAGDLDSLITNRIKKGNPNGIPQEGTSGKVYQGTRDETTINHITIHYTAGNGTKPAAYLGMLKKGDLGGMAQIYLDEDDALQVIGDDYFCYHSGYSTWDATSMGIEVCSVRVSGKTDRERYKFKKATIEKLVAVTRAMIVEYGITDIDNNVYRHYDCTVANPNKSVSNYKNCPAMWVNVDKYGQKETEVSPAWKAFKEALKTGVIDWGRMEGTYV